MKIKYFSSLLTVLLFCATMYSQLTDTAWKKIYRAAPTKINDLVHTKLDVKFDYNKSWMYGKEWVTLHPHFYPTDSLNLDAKGMTINEISVIKSGKKYPLKYVYDSLNLRITLDKTYKANENYTIYIDYVSRPDELPYASVGAPKGLYFINPKGEDKNKAIQIWTQGYPDFTSAWLPTIDKPNQKTTEEIRMTVPAKYVTMSNGLLVNKKTNGDGTRTDTWKTDKPNAPYLFFMGVGEYAIVKDNYKNKEVSYYVEKENTSLARKNFGLTPEMMALFSKLTGVDYPWEKYVQIIGKDHFGGSMENTSATLHPENIEQDARQLVDYNGYDQWITHELFHQWFGDYVTCESWSNLTLNESFANYGSVLWMEYKYGKDEADEVIFGYLKTYLTNPQNEGINLVHFYYANEGNLIDNVNYDKGACILHMLRNYVGDSAFFKSLNLYLTKHKYSNAEAQDLRLAFEEVTGKDLNWFFNQWYYGSGHPKLDISYNYSASTKIAKVFMKQVQTGNVFKLPVAIDVYEGGNKKRYQVWMTNQADTFSFAVNSKPDLINVDGDKILLCEKTDHKTLNEFIYQYKNAGLNTDRREAIDFASKYQTDARPLDFLKIALNDKSDWLRSFTLSKLNIDNDTVKTAVEMITKNLATADSKPIVRAEAIRVLGNYKKNEYRPLFMKAVNDSSYTVAGNALEALSKIDSAAAEAEAKKLSVVPARGKLKEVLNNYIDESKFDSVATVFDKLDGSLKANMLSFFSNFLSRVKNADNLEKGVDMIVKFRESVPQEYRKDTDPIFNDTLKGIAEKKQAAGLKEQSNYIKSKLPADKLKQ